MTDNKPNLIELVCYNCEPVTNSLYDVTFSNEVFFDRLERTKKMRLKYSEKSFRRFQMHDMEFISFPDVNDKFQVYKKQLTEGWAAHPAIKVLFCPFKRDTLNAFAFPWSTRLHDAASVTRITFRFTQNWNLIFERRTIDDSVTHQSETMNYIWFQACDVDPGTWEPMIRSCLTAWGMGVGVGV
jgi:hypothetical protein